VCHTDELVIEKFNTIIAIFANWYKTLSYSVWHETAAENWSTRRTKQQCNL